MYKSMIYLEKKYLTMCRDDYIFHVRVIICENDQESLSQDIYFKVSSFCTHVPRRWRGGMLPSYDGLSKL